MRISCCLLLFFIVLFQSFSTVALIIEEDTDIVIVHANAHGEEEIADVYSELPGYYIKNYGSEFGHFFISLHQVVFTNYSKNFIFSFDTDVVIQPPELT